MQKKLLWRAFLLLHAVKYSSPTWHCKRLLRTLRILEETMKNKGLLRMTSRKPSRSTSLSTTACTSVDTFVIVYALLNRVDGCARYADKVCAHSLYVMHEEVQKLSLDCLFAEPFWNTQQHKKLFLRLDSHKASGRLNKSRIITTKRPEL